MTRTATNLDLILFGWVGALCRRNPDRIADRLAPDIVWQSRSVVSRERCDGGWRQRDPRRGVH